MTEKQGWFLSKHLCAYNLAYAIHNKNYPKLLATIPFDLIPVSGSNQSAVDALVPLNTMNFL
jgi:hypothetical protein